MRINIKAPSINSLQRQYKQSSSASIGTSPIYNTNNTMSPPLIKMPNENNAQQNNRSNTVKIYL